MMQEPPPSSLEVLAGAVERVTFHGEDSGFCVLRVKARGHRELVTVVGHAAAVAAGEWITASGEWVNDRTYGPQFRSRFLKATAPTSTEGIEKYLGSGMIRGVGPVYAKKLVRAFGERVFDVIESEPRRLREVGGIGPVRAERITAAWAEQKAVREIMMFLHGHGVGTARAVRIFRTYGADAVQVMSENPYRLACDIRGIGFRTADAIAMRLGIGKSAMIRLRAGVAHALTEAMDDGHCGLPAEELRPAAAELLEAPEDLVRTAIDEELAAGNVVADRVGETPCVFLADCTGPSTASPSGCTASRPDHSPGRGSTPTRPCPGSSGGPDSISLQARSARSGSPSLPRCWSLPAVPASARPPSSTPSSASWPPRAPGCCSARPPAAPRGA